MEAGASGVVRSATFAVLIILIVFFPILTLTGIEGKYFTPMAKTLVFCIIGALILSLTYVPMMASLFLKRTISANPPAPEPCGPGLFLHPRSKQKSIPCSFSGHCPAGPCRGCFGIAENAPYFSTAPRFALVTIRA